MAQGIAGLTGQINATIQLAGNAPVAANDLNPLKAEIGFSLQALWNGGAAGNAGNVARAIDQGYANVANIPAGSNVQIDLSSFVNLLNASAASFARVKGIVIRNTSVAQDATFGANATSVTVAANGTNGFTGQGNSGWFGNANSNIHVPNGGFLIWGVDNAAGVAVDGTHKIIDIVNNDAGNNAKVLVAICGGNI